MRLIVPSAEVVDAHGNGVDVDEGNTRTDVAELVVRQPARRCLEFVHER
jgi:hypothetical protein